MRRGAVSGKPQLAGAGLAAAAYLGQVTGSTHHPIWSIGPLQWSIRWSIGPFVGPRIGPFVGSIRWSIHWSTGPFIRPNHPPVQKPPPSLDTGIEAGSVWVFTLAAAAAAAAFTRHCFKSLVPPTTFHHIKHHVYIPAQ